MISEYLMLSEERFDAFRRPNSQISFPFYTASSLLDKYFLDKYFFGQMEVIFKKAK